MTVLTIDPSWLQRAGHFGKGAKCACPKVAAQKVAWPAYDLADAMERGVAREVATHLTGAPAKGMRELTVRRSKDQREHELRGEDGDTLLVARARDGERSFDLCLPGAAAPAFVLKHFVDEDVWELQGQRCQRCAYRSPTSRGSAHQTLLRLSHERLAVGSGYAMCMRVELPADGTVWCGCTGGCTDDSAGNCQLLASRMPTWSSRLKSLTLDFKPRIGEASPRNFQLALGERAEDAKLEDAVLHFGKMGVREFCLDFSAPLGTVQAFAIALTSSFFR